MSYGNTFGALVRRKHWEFFDDFNMKVLDETNENWILNAGSDDLAVDPAVVVAAGGTIFLDAGDGDGSIAEDGSQIILAIPIQAGSGGLEFEARVQLEDITGCSVNIGLTDVTTLEEPFSIATDTITSVATDAVAFVFDTAADEQEWYLCGVANDVDSTDNVNSGVAPEDDTWQTLRGVINASGNAEMFIDNVSVGTLAGAVTADVNLYLTVTICGDGANAVAVGLTIDYLKLKSNR